MNSRSSFIVLLICAILLFALVAKNGSVMALALPFLVYLVIGAINSPAAPKLGVARSIERTEAASGEPITVGIDVKNEGGPLANIFIGDAVPHGVTASAGQAGQRMALDAAESTRFEYIITAGRGIHTWNAVRATASDPFGLFEVTSEIGVPGEVCIQPTRIAIRDVPIRPRSTLHAPGPTPARLAGAGTDFWGIREYRPGDPPRRLNWRLGGRHPRRLFTNEFEGAEVADLGFILDARRLTDAHEMEDALFERSVSAAAAIAESFLDKGDRVALLVFGERVSTLFPGSGKLQLNRVRHELARAALGPKFSMHYLEYFPARVFPSRSVIVAFSGVDARDLGTYARLRSFGYEILLVSPDPVDYMRKALAQTHVNALAARAARLERTIQFKRLVKMGVGVIDWRVDQPLDAILQRTARALAQRRRA